MKKSLVIFLFASSLVAQVQIGKNVQIGAGATSSGFITSLTTTGTSGAATVTSGVLNIPQYTFNFTLGSTAITGGSTVTAVTGLSVNGVSLNAAGSSTLFLNQAGGYTAPATGGSSVGTAGQLQMVGSTAGSFAASSVTDNGTTVTSSKPVTVNDGTGKAGNIGLLAGTAPLTAPANTVQINAPAAVTAYAINLPGAQPTAGNTRLDCTAANPAVCSWASAGGSGTVTSVSVTTANGVSGSVATATTTPAITLTLGAITPTSTNGVSAATMAFNDATSSIQTQLNAKTGTIASGTSALGTSVIASATCATVVTTTATGTASTDAIIWNPNASIKAVTGYVPSTAGGLTIAGYPTTNSVNWDVCNWTSASITPGAVTLNWRVVR